MYNDVKKCYKCLIKDDEENGFIRENYAEFLKEIGEYELSK
jgi:hypothetical protein